MGGQRGRQRTTTTPVSKEEHDAEGTNAAGNGRRPSRAFAQEPTLQDSPPEPPETRDQQANSGK